MPSLLKLVFVSLGVWQIFSSKIFDCCLSYHSETFNLVSEVMLFLLLLVSDIFPLLLSETTEWGLSLLVFFSGWHCHCCLSSVRLLLVFPRLLPKIAEKTSRNVPHPANSVIVFLVFHELCSSLEKFDFFTADVAVSFSSSSCFILFVFFQF